MAPSLCVTGSGPKGLQPSITSYHAPHGVTNKCKTLNMALSLFVTGSGLSGQLPSCMNLIKLNEQQLYSTGCILSPSVTGFRPSRLHIPSDSMIPGDRTNVLHWIQCCFLWWLFLGCQGSHSLAHLTILPVMWTRTEKCGISSISVCAKAWFEDRKTCHSPACIILLLAKWTVIMEHIIQLFLSPQ